MQQTDIKLLYTYISTTVLEQLAKDDVEFTDIYAFALYLKLATLRSITPELIDARVFYTAAILYLNEENESGVINTVQSISNNEAKSELLDIRNDVWEKKFFRKQKWINCWIDICSGFVRSYDDKQNALFLIFKIINDVLELDDNTDLNMYALINHVLFI